MAKHYELWVPGIGMSQTKHGSLMFRFTGQNILKLRDALALASEKLTEMAVQIIEEEREEEKNRMIPPPDPERRHEMRVAHARRIPNNVAKSIERAKAASRGVTESVTPNRTSSIPSNRRVVSTKEDSPPENGTQKTFVSGGFETDDGSLGEPPASIR